MTEVYIVAIREDRTGRTATRHPLHVPLDLAVGHLERLSDLAIRETIKDLAAEQERRNAGAPEPTDAVPDNPAPPAPWNPMSSQIKGAR